MVGAGMEIEEVVQDGPRLWIILGTKSSLASAGELVRVVVDGPAQGPVIVRVVTKKRMATNVFALDDWSGAIFQRMDAELGPGS